MSQDLIPAEPIVPAIATDDPRVKVLMDRLKQPTPKSVIKYRPGPGDKMFPYVPWAWVAQTLNEVFGPTWGREVLATKEIPLPDMPPRHYKCRRDVKGTGCSENHKARKRTEMVANVRLTTPWGAYDAVGSHTWYLDNAEQGPGDAMQAAVSKGFKRAASLLGVGLDLYAELPDEFEVEADLALLDAQKAWRKALKDHGLVERGAIPLLSRILSGDPKALTSLQDLLDATGKTGPQAYEALITQLEEGMPS